MFNTKSIIKDVNKKPVPQYFNPDSDRYEVIQSSGGHLKVLLIDSVGNAIVTQDIVNQIESKLDELIEAVNPGGL